MRTQSQRSARLFLLLFGLFTLLYTANIDGWLLHDDEGTDFYEAWRLAEGERPGEDFLAEQQPLFLLAGQTLISLFGQAAAPLRLLSAGHVLLGVLILSLALYRVWGGTTAILALGFTLTSGLVYEQARLFRPDPQMLGWEMTGLAMALLASQPESDSRKRFFWMLSGACFGLALSLKLFGAFPVLGLAFYFLYRFWKQPNRWRLVFFDGLAFVAPFLLTSLVLSGALYTIYGFYYLEPLSYHLSMGEGTALIVRADVLLRGLLFFFLVNASFLLLLPLWWLNRKNQAGERGEPDKLLLAQLLVPLIFLAITRPLYVRYLLFLIPVFAALLGREIQIAFEKLSREEPLLLRFRPLLLASILLFSAFATRPALAELLTRQEEDTQVLAALVRGETEASDVILSDYAGINFFANRPSIYEATIIAGAQIEGAVITGDLLRDRMEAKQAEMVLLHVAGGQPGPHQLVQLVDYEEFRDYLHEQYRLVTHFNRVGQVIEVYQRR